MCSKNINVKNAINKEITSEYFGNDNILSKEIKNHIKNIPYTISESLKWLNVQQLFTSFV